ncbi:hypothetical protein NM688_g3649 [Phlebia brevispora]|uniref:Uncharacterized protein n=1 Tax=Phlebia brevispora TaxID=194682 RepID=A0ACC1T5T1_9APHY|nr:hypothetical protein NM688_g3649 [Phlebia brevispora]
MLLHPTLPKFSCCPVLTHEEHGASMQQLSLVTHCGTHIDAPAHFFSNGMTVDSIPLSKLHGKAMVLDVTKKGPRERIYWSDISTHEDELRYAASSGGIVLFRTDWSKYWGNEKYFDHPFLDGDTARKLVELGVQTIGIDAMGPDETKVGVSDVMAESDFTVHRVALGAGMVIAENLTNLDKIQSGSWVVSVMPLKISGGDGSPVRAYAVRIE